MSNEKVDPKRSYRGKAAEDRSAERRARFITAGMALFGTQGYAATSVKALCGQAGLTERYFYESFENREDLFLAVGASCVSGLMFELLRVREDQHADLNAKIQAMLKALFTWFQDDPRRARVQLFEPLFISPKLHTLYRQVNLMFANFLGEVLLLSSQNRSAISERELGYLTSGLVGATIEILKEWVLSEFDRPITEVIASASVFYKALYFYFQKNSG